MPSIPPSIPTAAASPTGARPTPRAWPSHDQPGRVPTGEGFVGHGAIAATPEANLLIARFDARADLSDEAAMPRGPERKQAVYDDLAATAEASQAQARETLDRLRADGDVTGFESLVMPNAILVSTKPGRHQAVADALAGVANVKAVTQNRLWSVDATTEDVPSGGAVDAATGATAPEWGVDMIRADDAWARGIDGSGVTVGIVDTGLDSSHPAIREHYRGTQADGSQVHDYNWFDPFTHRPDAFDDGQHGTHVAGTSAGGTDGHAIGVAPGAKLIAAKAINGRGYNSTAATLQALQFMLAPTKTDGSAPDPTKGADVVNNSWGNPGDPMDDTFLESFEALRAAGIEVVTSAGNEGPREGTVSAPGSYPGFLSVAATTSRDSVAGFSSRGPSKFPSKDDMSPNVAAPGEGIVSSVPGGRYSRMSGTSMASPHVAGAVALLLQARPDATHDEIVQALTKTAVDVDRAGPDNASGYGRIDVVRALDELGPPKDAA